MGKFENSRRALRDSATQNTTRREGGQHLKGGSTQKAARRRRMGKTLRAVLGLRSVRIWLYLAFLGTLFAFIGVGNIFVCLSPFAFLVGLVFALWLVGDFCKITPRLFALWVPAAPTEEENVAGWNIPTCEGCLFRTLNEGGKCFGQKKHGVQAPCEYFTPSGRQ
jgi:hypothetical protein